MKRAPDSPRLPPTSFRQHGFTLLEVMIAFLLTGVVALGLVAQQGRSRMAIHDSVSRTQAVYLAEDMLEMIRASERPQTLYNHPGQTLPDGGSSACSHAVDSLDCWSAWVRSALNVDEYLVVNHLYACPSSAPGQCSTTGEQLEVQLAWYPAGGNCPPSGRGYGFCFYRLRGGGA